MSLKTVEPSALVDWAVAGRPVAGESVSGDMHVVQVFDQGVLLALVDGVGHGEAAAATARRATRVLRAHAQESVVSLFRLCHQALTKTRGVVMTAASLNSRNETLTWVGVGNIEGWLFRADPSQPHARVGLLLHNGLVGYQLPSLRSSVLPLAPRDLLVFATDGIRAGFQESLNRTASPQQLADQVLRQYSKGTDDALVLAVRYLRVQHE